MRTLHLFVPLLVVVAVAGCHKSLDMDKLAKNIRETVQTQLAPSKVTTVDCPKGHALKKDDDFPCTITFASGGVMTATVHQKNDDGDVEWHVTHYDIDGPHLEAVMTERTTQTPKPSFHCPDGAHFDLPGSWICDVTVAGQAQRVKFTMQKDGSVVAGPAS